MSSVPSYVFTLSKLRICLPHWYSSVIPLAPKMSISNMCHGVRITGDHRLFDLVNCVSNRSTILQKTFIHHLTKERENCRMATDDGTVGLFHFPSVSNRARQESPQESEKAIKIDSSKQIGK